MQKTAKEKNKTLTLFTGDLNNKEILEKIFNNFSPTVVIHLAAQAGVRFSITNPSQYIYSNLVGFGNILEKCRHHKTANLIYASSSSVYGGTTKIPFSENDAVNHPISLYAATKRSNELMAHTYSHLFGIPTTGLRFFTVYGPWGRPDMAPMIFTNAIFKNKPIHIFNNGQMSRDFTYIDDVIETIFRLFNKPASANLSFNKDLPELSSSWAPYKIFNVGNSDPVNLMEFLETLELQIGKKSIKILRI